MPQALLVGIFVVIGAVFFFIVRRINSSQANRSAVADASWRQVDKVGDLINLYLDMALKYGPRSREANSFRFGITNSELWGGDKNSEALATFEQITKHFDDALLRNERMFRWFGR